MSTILYFYSLLLICIFPIFSFDRINLDQSCKSSNQCTLHKWTILDSYSEEFVHLETDPPNSKTIEQFPIIVKNIYPNTKSTDFTLRTEFHFPKENLLQNLILGIHLQAIGDAYSIYLNGSLIGKDGEVKNGKVIYSRYGVNVNYPIRLMNLKEGKNILVIYLQGNPKFNLLGLFRTKGYYIDTYDKILYESRDRIGLILIGLYFFFGIFYLFIYFKVRHEKNYLYFSILSLSVFIYSVSRDGIFYEYGLDSTTGYKLELMAVYISPLFLGIFLKSLFFERLGKYLKFYITYCTLLFITTPFMKQDFIIYVQLAWQISVFVTVFFYFYIFYTAQKQKLESARRLMISFFIMIFFLVYDILDSIFF